MLFSAGNAKKNVFTVFTVPIVTIDGFADDGTRPVLETRPVQPDEEGLALADDDT